MTKKLYIGIGILLAFSLSIFVFGTLYQNSLPKIVEEINNSALGAILTAFITVLLLSQQSKSEEVREQNVRVFEKRSEKYNQLIEELWKVWEDRRVTLDELYKIMTMITKDIILYTKPATVENILGSLNNIAQKINESKSETDLVSNEDIQTSIYDIIDVLAKEVGLGGGLEKEVRVTLKELETNVASVYIKNEYKKKYIENFISTVSSQWADVEKIYYENKHIMCQIKDSPVFLRIGPLERGSSSIEKPRMGFYIDFSKNQLYRKYQTQSAGQWKNYSGDMKFFNPSDIIDFDNSQMMRDRFYVSKSQGEETPSNDLALLMNEYRQNWRYEGKSIDEIIEECSKS